MGDPIRLRDRRAVDYSELMRSVFTARLRKLRTVDAVRHGCTPIARIATATM